jgi:hypothetical protein
MTVETQDITVDTDEHIVHFYEHEAELVGMVVPYLSAAIRAGETAIVIATEAHRRAFETQLEAEDVDLAPARTAGRLLTLDAAVSIATFTAEEEEIDHDAFHEMIGGLVRKAAECGRPVRVYGEMVALLWDAGEVLTAIELETLWNDLARELSFSLLCSYPASSVSGSEHAEALHQVCHLHSSVVPPWSEGQDDVATRSIETEMTAEFAPDRGAPGRARRMVVATLQQAGCAEALVHDAALVLSELATNAVLHAGSPFSVSICWKDPILRIAVRDASPLENLMPEQCLIPQPGHGLGLIDVLCACWGAESADDGKVVWTELRA